MEFRHLGRSGLQISEITYGNWLTHGSQVENDVATACVHKALDLGIDHDTQAERGWLAVHVEATAAEPLTAAMTAAGWNVRPTA